MCYKILGGKLQNPPNKSRNYVILGEKTSTYYHENEVINANYKVNKVHSTDKVDTVDKVDWFDKVDRVDNVPSVE